MNAIKSVISRLRYAAGQVDLKLADDGEAELATIQARIEKLENKLALCLIKLSEIDHESYADTIAEDVFETWQEIRRKAGRK